MASRTMMLKPTNIHQANGEGVVLKDNNQWSSPSGGWLPVQAGVYDQLPDGVHLHNAPQTLRVAVLRGLNFQTSAKNDTGTALYPSLGATGNTGIAGKWHLGLGVAAGPDWNHDITPGPLDVGFTSSFIMAGTGDRVPTVYVENRRVAGLDPRDPITVSYDKPVGDWLTGRGRTVDVRVDVDQAWRHVVT